MNKTTEHFYKCNSHPSMNCEMLFVDPNTNQHLICSDCIKEKNIPDEQVIHIDKVLDFIPSSSNLIFEMPIYASISSKINTQLFLEDNTLKEVDSYFEDLLKQIKNSLDSLLKEQRKIVEKKNERIIKAGQFISEATSITPLQKILNSQDKNIENELNQFFKNQHSKSSKKEKLILQKLDEIDEIKSKFCLDNPRQILKQIKSLIQEINLFDKKFRDMIRLCPITKDIKEKWELGIDSCLPCSKVEQQDQNLDITSVNNQIFINTLNDKQSWRQSYLTKILQSQSKYIIRLSLLNQTMNYPIFYFGLIKDFSEQISSGINYSQYYGGGNTKIIKGKKLHSESYQVGIINLEFRICIGEQFFRVSSFPDYENVAEAKDKEKINKNQEYYFAISFGVPKESVTIREILEVTKFDELM